MIIAGEFLNARNLISMNINEVTMPIYSSVSTCTHRFADFAKQ